MGNSSSHTAAFWPVLFLDLLSWLVLLAGIALSKPLHLHRAIEKCVTHSDPTSGTLGMLDACVEIVSCPIQHAPCTSCRGSCVS